MIFTCLHECTLWLAILIITVGATLIHPYLGGIVTTLAVLMVHRLRLRR